MATPKSQKQDTVGVPLRVVVRRTGLSADTLRIWEKRHAAVVPLRTEGRARRFSEEQIERLVLLRDAVKRGRLISEVASMTDAELVAFTRPMRTRSNLRASKVVSACLEALSSFDVETLGTVLNRASNTLDSRVFALDVVRPLLQQIGQRWTLGLTSIGQEHFASEEIRAVCLRLLRKRAESGSSPRILFAAPSGHQHDLGLHICALLGSRLGYAPILLGRDSPLEEIADAARRLSVRTAVLAVSRDLSDSELRELASGLEQLNRQVHVLLGVPAKHSLIAAVREAVRTRALGVEVAERPIRILESFEEFEEALREFDD